MKNTPHTVPSELKQSTANTGLPATNPTCIYMSTATKHRNLRMWSGCRSENFKQSSVKKQDGSLSSKSEESLTSSWLVSVAAPMLLVGLHTMVLTWFIPVNSLNLHMQKLHYKLAVKDSISYSHFTLCKTAGKDDDHAHSDVTLQHSTDFDICYRVLYSLDHGSACWWHARQLFLWCHHGLLTAMSWQQSLDDGLYRLRHMVT